jgi:hypothetical protein
MNETKTIMSKIQRSLVELTRLGREKGLSKRKREKRRAVESKLLQDFHRFRKGTYLCVCMPVGLWVCTCCNIDILTTIIVAVLSIYLTLELLNSLYVCVLTLVVQSRLLPCSPHTEFVSVSKMAHAKQQELTIAQAA